MNQNQGSTNGQTGGLKIEAFDPAPLRIHPLHKGLPAIQVDSAEWHAFVDAVSAAGAEGIPPIYVTEEGFVMDGERRLKAAKQLQWRTIYGVVRPEWEAAALIVESLLGQRSYSKGAKVYLSLPLLEEYRKSSESRRLAALKRGQNLQKPLNSPLAHSIQIGKASEQLGERLGCSARLVEQAVAIRRFFELPALREHLFQFQRGVQMTLKGYFEPRILDSENPMGLGEVLKGIGWFVDENGKPKDQAPPARNSHLFYWDRAWRGWAKGCGRWEELDTDERNQALGTVKEVVRDLPDQVVAGLGEMLGEEKKRRRKVENRSSQKETKETKDLAEAA